MLKVNHRQIGFIAAQIVAVAALLFSTYFLNRLAGFTAECFNSQIIDRFVLFSERVEVPHCRRNWGWGGERGTAPSHWTLQWPRVTTKLDRILEVWPVPAHRYQMIVVSQDPFVTERSETQIVLGGAIARQPGNWLREIVRNWVVDSTAGQSEVEQLVLADFLTAVADDEFTVSGLNGLARAGENVVWQNSALNPEGYCLSPWRDPKDFEACDPAAVTELHGIKPLFSRALWEMYRTASWQERRHMWRWLKNEVGQGRESLFHIDQLKLSALEKLNQTLSHWAKRIYATPERQAQVLFRLKTRLGLKSAASPFMVVEAGQGIEKHWGRFESLVRVEGTLQWWSAQERIYAVPVTGKPIHWVRVDCRIPMVGEIAGLAAKTVLFVQSCAPETLNGWDSLSQHDFKSFIAANPEVGVIWLNAQGLRQALQNESVLASAKVSLRRLRHSSHWREDSWDASALAFKPSAAIDLVLSHRASRDLL